MENEIKVERITVVKVQFCRGEGTEADPKRIVDAYYTDNNTLLAEYDCEHRKLIDNKTT